MSNRKHNNIVIDMSKQNGVYKPAVKQNKRRVVQTTAERWFASVQSRK